MSDTPRTDEVEYEMWQSQVGSRMRKCKDGGWVFSDFARELERENAALRHSEENLAATVRGLEFELEKAQKTAPWLGGTVEALGDANDRLTIEISGLRKDKERLDWLDVNCTRVADSERYLPTTVYWGKGTHRDIRAAIDAARAKEGGAS